MDEEFKSDFNFSKYLSQIQNSDPIKYVGHISGVNGLKITSTGPRAKIGEICRIHMPDGSELASEVTGLSGNTVELAAYGLTDGIEVGCEVIGTGETLKVPVGWNLIGRTINAEGKPCDGLGEIVPEQYYPVVKAAPDENSKLDIDRRIKTGIRAIDSMLTVGKGQRIGIFAGSGVGKSTIMGMIARNTDADINVIGLIGERGREVPEFIKKDLGPEGMKRSVVVVATGDEPSICRMRAAQVCTAIAEFFRDQGKDVILMMDNVTRYAKAMREISLSNGESPAQRGYPPSVFDAIPKLLERTGTNDKGTITAFYAVLVDGDDMDEPIADCVRGVLDGHIVLSRKLASAYHYPAIDILASISRLAKNVSGRVTKKAVGKVRQLMSVYQTNSQMILAGIYQKGSSPEIDEAIDKHEAVEEFLKQEEYESSSIKETLDRLSELTEIDIPEEEYGEKPGISVPKYEVPAENAVKSADEEKLQGKNVSEEL